MVRLLAEGTLEAAILKMQQRKMASQQPGEGADALTLAELEVDAGTLVNIISDHPPLPK